MRAQAERDAGMRAQMSCSIKIPIAPTPLLPGESELTMAQSRDNAGNRNQPVSEDLVPRVRAAEILDLLPASDQAPVRGEL